MAERLITTRIKLKTDTESNWGRSGKALMLGEVAISYRVSAEGAFTDFKFKVGDGERVWRELPWMTAADVDIELIKDKLDARYVLNSTFNDYKNDIRAELDAISSRLNDRVTAYVLQDEELLVLSEDAKPADLPNVKIKNA